MQIISNSEKDTFRTADDLSRGLKPGDVLALTGELGSGKSVFARGLLHGFGIKDKYIASPTFTLINIYKGKLPVYHFDVYRLNSPDELINLGYEEFFFGDGVTIIEWADKVKDFLPEKYIKIELKVLSEKGRLITIDQRPKTEDLRPKEAHRRYSPLAGDVGRGGSSRKRKA